MWGGQGLRETAKIEERLGEVGRPLVHWPLAGRAVTPVVEVSSLPWPSPLLSLLPLTGLSQPLPLQALLWPTISRLQSSLSVAEPGQGSTLAWLLPLTALLYDKHTYSDLPAGPGPLLVVLCPGLEVVTSLATLIQELVLKVGLELRVVEDCAGARRVEPALFLNGLEVLLTTPTRLHERLTASPSLIGLERCRHLVLERAETMVELWQEQVI